MIEVIDMNPRVIQCFICNEWDDHRWGVPTFNGDVVSNDVADRLPAIHSGNQPVCERCYYAHLNGELEVFDRFYGHWLGGFINGGGI